MILYTKEEYENYLNTLNVQPNSNYDTIIKGGGGFLGIKGKHIYTVSMHSSKMFDEDQYESTRNRLIVDKAKNNLSTLDYLYGFSRVGNLQLSKYLNAGNNYYKEYLPEATFTALSIPKDLIKNIIEKEINSSIYIIENSYSLLFEEDWCKYQLQEKINYSVNDDFVKLNNSYYEYSNYTFNNNTNNYDVVLNTISKLIEEKYKITSIKITNKNNTTDIKTTEIIYKYNYFRPRDSKLVYSNIVIDSTISEEIPKDSVKEDYSVEFISKSDINNASSSITIEVPSFNTNNKYYRILYKNLSDNKTYIWIYDTNTNLYPDINNPIKSTVTSEIYPVAIVRDNFTNITGERLDKTTSLLSSIGVDIDSLFKSIEDTGNADKIQESFLLFGVSPSESDPIVSKVLYETIDYIYKELGEQTSNSYSLYFKEDPYFSNILWTNTNTEIKEEKILDVGDCSHTNNVKAVYVQRYVTIQFDSIEKDPELTTSRYRFIVNFYEEKVTEENIILDTKLINTEYHYYDWWEINKYKNIIVETIQTSVDPDIYKNYTVEVFLSMDKNVYTSSRVMIKQYPTNNLIVTKQIDKTHTKSYTLQDFIGNYTISHEKGVSVISLNGANTELVIPLLVPVAQRLSIIEKTKLLDNIIYLHYYAFDHQYLKWYQTGAFGELLKAISVCIVIIVTIFSLGSATAPAVKLTALLWTLLETIVITVGLTLALKLIITHVKSDFLKMVLSVAAIAVATYSLGGFSDFGFIEAVSLANSCIDAFNIYLEDKADILNQNIQNFNEEYSNRIEEFDASYKELTEGLDVSDIADITIKSIDININPYKFDTSSYYYLALEAYKDFDTLYNFVDTSVSSFVDKKLNLTGD